MKLEIEILGIGKIFEMTEIQILKALSYHREYPLKPGTILSVKASHTNTKNGTTICESVYVPGTKSSPL